MHKRKHSIYYQALKAPKGTPYPYKGGSEWSRIRWEQGQKVDTKNRMTDSQWAAWDRYHA